MFKLGTKVKRPWNIYDETPKYRFGTICARVSVKKRNRKIKGPYNYEFESIYGPYKEVYAVIWDDEPTKIAWGFLPHGLEHV